MSKRPVQNVLMYVDNHVEMYHVDQETKTGDWYFVCVPKAGGPQYWEQEGMEQPKPWGYYVYEKSGAV